LTYAEAPHPYTPAVAAGGFVFVSGRLGVRDGVFVDGGVEAEASQALRNAEAELAAFDLDLTNAVKVTVFLADIGDLQAFNRAYAAVMPEPRPARSCVAVDALPFNGRVEIEIVASAQRRNALTP
jgi:2-iminobutanoate/2-iminopropanoate deaminase